MTALQVADWTSACESLVERGWVRLGGAIDASLAGAMLAAAPGSWHELPREEGRVRQAGISCYSAFDDADGAVQDFGEELVARIVPLAPAFNEVTWVTYPGGEGHITAHRDPVGVGGVIAVATRAGAATFRVVAPSGATECPAAAGDVILIRGYGWPTPDGRCPTHEVDPPPEGERVIMTLRHNRNGAGSGYEYGGDHS